MDASNLIMEVEIKIYAQSVCSEIITVVKDGLYLLI